MDFILNIFGVCLVGGAGVRLGWGAVAFLTDLIDAFISGFIKGISSRDQ